jgi:hypothetical protein
VLLPSVPGGAELLAVLPYSIQTEPAPSVMESGADDPLGATANVLSLNTFGVVASAFLLVGGTADVAAFPQVH